MFNIFNQAMFYLLSQIQGLVGSYGMAIVLLTVATRVVLWPLNSAQIRSMKKMQELQPKLKQLQERYKDQPQKMQEALMKFYAENRFNPFAGCFPLIVQLPIFIGLYGALSSPDFLAVAGNENFLFIDKLYHTLQSHAGDAMDGRFNVKQGDQFDTGPEAVIQLKSGKQLTTAVQNPQQVIATSPSPLIPGEPVTLTLDLQKMGLSVGYEELVQSLSLPIIGRQSRELERLVFTNQRGHLSNTVETVAAKSAINYDVLILIGLYGLAMFLHQKVTQRPQPGLSETDAMQARMMKLMPLMFLVMLFFIPIPAGVMLYLVVTTVLMLVQSLYVQWREDNQSPAADGSRPAKQILDIKPNGGTT